MSTQDFTPGQLCEALARPTPADKAALYAAVKSGHERYLMDIVRRMLERQLRDDANGN